MFTGIIEEIGIVTKLMLQDYGSIQIQAKKILSDIHIGDSISVNGVCLTVINFDHSSFTVDVMAETLRRSNLGELKRGSNVNLERAMAVNGRFGGHIVSGHIDTIGIIRKKTEEGNAVWFTIACEEKFLDAIVEKGSITIDGISLTVAEVSENEFEVSVIPHTTRETTLLQKKEGQGVNLETDVIAKYLKRLFQKTEIQKESKISLEFLQENGF